MSQLTQNYQQERLQALKGQLAYTQNALQSDLASWERKEYEMVAAEYQKDIAELEACLARQTTA